MKKIGIIFLVLLLGCSVNQYPSRAIVQKALSLVGAPYRYGGDSPSRGFDCSGLVYYVYRSVGIRIPRTAEEQLRKGKKLHLRQIKPGDLLFFRFRNSLHVGIFVAPGYMVHASPERGVVKERLGKYWRKHFVKGVRYL